MSSASMACPGSTDPNVISTKDSTSREVCSKVVTVMSKGLSTASCWPWKLLCRIAMLFREIAYHRPSAAAMALVSFWAACC